MTATPQAPTAAHMEAYVASLKAHDWGHEFSGDTRVYRAGKESLIALRIAQGLIDPDFTVWNTWAPPDYRITKSSGTEGSAA